MRRPFTFPTTRTATALLAIAATLILGGCAMITPPEPGPQKTGQQLRAQLITDATAAITASGLPNGWAFGPEPGARPWNPDTKEFLGSNCSTANNETRQRYLVPLYHPPVGDPVAFVQKMGDYWTQQGYIVSLVGDPVTAPASERFALNRADRADGSLAAGAAAQNNYFVLTFYTECSTDPTLNMFAGPTGYREFDMLDPSPYYPTNSPTITPYPDH